MHVLKRIISGFQHIMHFFSWTVQSFNKTCKYFRYYILQSKPCIRVIIRLIIYYFVWRFTPIPILPCKVGRRWWGCEPRTKAAESRPGSTRGWVPPRRSSLDWRVAVNSPPTFTDCKRCSENIQRFPTPTTHSLQYPYDEAMALFCLQSDSFRRLYDKHMQNVGNRFKHRHSIFIFISTVLGYKF